MENFEPSKMPTPLLGIFIVLNNIFFSTIGGIIVILWNETKKSDSPLSYYGLIFIIACYLTLIVISYNILRAIYNRYTHYIELRYYMRENNL